MPPGELPFAPFEDPRPSRVVLGHLGSSWGLWVSYSLCAPPVSVAHSPLAVSVVSAALGFGVGSEGFWCGREGSLHRSIPRAELKILTHPVLETLVSISVSLQGISYPEVEILSPLGNVSEHSARPAPTLCS